jgi:hypothetical protein
MLSQILVSDGDELCIKTKFRSAGSWAALILYLPQKRFEVYLDLHVHDGWCEELWFPQYW